LTLHFPTAPDDWLEELAPGAIAVGLADPVASDHPDHLTLLSADEQARHARYHFERDRQLYRVAHAMLRVMLGRHLGWPPAALGFEVGAHQRPRLTTPADLDFNLSHTRGLVAVAIAPRAEVGIDVEQVQASRVTANLEQTVFAPEELERLASMTRDEEVTAFFRLWTLKEAYLKVRGFGMGVLRLDAFAFDVDRARLVRAPDDPTRWTFETARPTDEHHLALAAYPPPGRVETHWACPLSSPRR